MAEKKEVKVTPEEEAFYEHYDRLTGALPIVKLLPKFISKRIITFSEQDKILAGETDFEKTKRFLKHITNHFSTGNTYNFYKFLEVVENHGGQYSYLATDIQATIVNKQQENKEEERVSQPLQATDDNEITVGEWLESGARLKLRGAYPLPPIYSRFFLSIQSGHLS